MPDRVRSAEVFTPGAFPSHSYVDRTGTNAERLLRDGLETPGTIVSISGPSKSGKTVLVEHVVGENLITVTGAGIDSADLLWDRVLDWMEAPHEQTSSSSSARNEAVSVSAGGSVGIPIVASGEASVEGRIEAGRESGAEATSRRRGLAQIVQEIGRSDFVLLVDDFHYIKREVQTEVARSLKEAARLGVKLVVASVPHRSGDVVRANPELVGRVAAVDLGYWNKADLTSIATAGFRKLNIEVDVPTVDGFVSEAAGSPQLMQAICLRACFAADVREQQDPAKAITFDEAKRRKVYEETSTMTDLRALVDVIDAGPKTRGTERNQFSFADGASGDVYRAVLRAIAAEPPRLTFPYAELLRRVEKECVGSGPAGSSVSGACSHMAKLAESTFPTERRIDWSDSEAGGVLDIPDPYLVFYLRWSRYLDRTRDSV